MSVSYVLIVDIAVLSIEMYSCLWYGMRCVQSSNMHPLSALRLLYLAEILRHNMCHTEKYIIFVFK